MTDSRSWFRSRCNLCGFNVVVTQPDATAFPRDDYWWYCSNKACSKHSVGEHTGDMEWPEWVELDEEETMNHSQVIEHMLKILNQALEADPAAITAMVNMRVTCNDALAGHPTIQCRVGVRAHDVIASAWADPHRPSALGDEEKTTTVGLLGILNGIAGIRSDGMGYIAAVVEDDGTISSFVRSTTPRKDHE